MDPVSGILGGLGSIGSSFLSNQFAQDAENRQQSRFISNFNLSNQTNLSNWNAQNAYNSPAAQMQRLSSAGVSPFLGMAGASAGGLSGTVSSPQGSGGSAMQGAVSNPAMSVASSMSAAAGLKQTEASTRLTNAQASGLEHENNVRHGAENIDTIDENGQPSKELSSEYGRQYRAGVQSSLSKAQSDKLDATYKGSSMPLNLDVLRNNIKEQGQSIQKSQQDIDFGKSLPPALRYIIDKVAPHIGGIVGGSLGRAASGGRVQFGSNGGHYDSKFDEHN